MEKQFIGRTALVTVGGSIEVPAKVDTGADSSSIWASAVQEVDGKLEFALFGPASPYYTGQRITLEADAYELTRVASSSGHRQARYAVVLPAQIADASLQVRFTLADRVSMVYPILLGRDMLAGRFLVDVERSIPVNLQETLEHEKRARVRALRSAKRSGGGK